MQQGVIFIVQRPDGTILMQQRDKDSEKFPLSWVLPGGGSEEGESFTQTLVRELFEEYEIQITENNATLITYFPHEHNAVYLCQVAQNCEPIMHEGEAMKWVTKEELKKTELGYGQNELVKVLWQ